jgi:hypothetical protein
VLIFEAAAPDNGTSQPNPGTTRRAESVEEMISLVEQVLGFSPREPSVSNYYQPIRTVHLLQSHTEEAVSWFARLECRKNNFSRAILLPVTS